MVTPLKLIFNNDRIPRFILRDEVYTKITRRLFTFYD